MREAGPLGTPDDAPRTWAGPRSDLGGPVLPTASAIAAQHPLPAPGARLTGGLLHAWQRRNAAASMPLALHQLVAAGNMDNLQLAIRAGSPADAGSGDGDGDGARSGNGARPAGADARSGVGARAAVAGYYGPVFMDSDIYKTLEAIGWELESARSPEPPRATGQPPRATGQARRGSDPAPADARALADFAATAVALLGRVQRPDGYLNSYVQASGEPRYASLASSHEMYCAGHLIQAAIALARGAGDRTALGIATKLADHLVREFAGQRKGLDGHPIIEMALVELYRETGTAAYRDLAKQFVDQRGHGLAGDSGMGRRYLQDHLEVRQRTTEVGHAVRALYLEAGVTDVATETGDAQLLESSRRRWDDMLAAKTYLTGGNGSRHNDEAFGDHFELPPDRAYNETCAAIAAFQWSWRLLLATGDPKYADHMERVLYNGFAAAINTEGVRFFYVNPLQRRADHYEKDDPGRRREWFKCACCPPNIMRLLASLHHYLSTQAGDTLYLHQYARAAISGAGLDIEVDTNYPWDGLVTIRVTGAPGDGAPGQDAERELALRVPAWSAAAAPPVLDVNGSSERVRVPPGGYLRVRRAWRLGDEVRLRLDMAPRWTYPDHRVDAVRGCVAIERGPLVYCFEQADQSARLDELTVVPGAPLTEEEAVLPGIGRTVTIGAPARHVPPVPAETSWSARPSPSPSPSPPDPSPAAPPTSARPLPGPSSGAAAQDSRPVPDQVAVTAVAIPYFQWDNRGPGPMRVWVPAAAPAPPVAP